MTPTGQIWRGTTTTGSLADTAASYERRVQGALPHVDDLWSLEYPQSAIAIASALAEVDTYREQLATLRNATLVALTTGDRPLSIAKAAGLTGLSVPRARQLLGR